MMTRSIRKIPGIFGVLCSVGLMLLAADAQADTYPRQPGIDAEHYVFRLTLLTDDSNQIQGEATVRLRITGACGEGRQGCPAPREAFLDLASATPDGKGMTVTGVTSNGRPVQFTHEQNRLKLPLPPNAKAGDEATFDIAYQFALATRLHRAAGRHRAPLAARARG